LTGPTSDPKIAARQTTLCGPNTNMNVNSPRNATLTRNFHARSYIVGVDETIEFPEGTRVFWPKTSRNYRDKPTDLVNVHIWTNEDLGKGFSCNVRRDALRRDANF